MVASNPVCGCSSSIMTACCSTPVPVTLYATVNCSCPACNGLVFPLTFSFSEPTTGLSLWSCRQGTTEFDVICDGPSGRWDINGDIRIPGGCQLVTDDNGMTTTSCSPSFVLHFIPIDSPMAGGACAGSNATIDVTRQRGPSGT